MKPGADALLRHRSTYRALPAALAALVAAGVAGCGTEAGRGYSSKSPERVAEAPAPASDRVPDPVARPRAYRPFTVVGTGDLLVHDSIIRQARADAGGKGYDFRPMLSEAKVTAEAADLAICHMETVYGKPNGPFSGYPSFKTPPHLAGAVKDSGYDSCSTASNHTLDAGMPGIRRTLNAMDRAGLQHAGSARNAKEARTPAWMHAGGAKVAHLAYTYGTNGIPKPKPWAVNLINTKRILADARAARRAGADVVIVSPHWGTEFRQAPDALQRRVARALTASPDIDLILGTHAHVPQAYEKRNGKWVVYGMGNQISGIMNDPRGSMGSAARFTFSPPEGTGPDARWKVTKAEFIPTYSDPTRGYRALNLPRTLEARPKLEKQVQARDIVRKAVLSGNGAKHGLLEGR